MLRNYLGNLLTGKRRNGQIFGVLTTKEFRKKRKKEKGGKKGKEGEKEEKQRKVYKHDTHEQESRRDAVI